jgi:hypothetical protein
VAQNPDTVRLEKYLESLQLDRLLIEHLEREVGRETDRDKRIQTARRLAQLYTSELLKTQVDADTARYWIRKSNGLLAIYPGLRNSPLTMAILQARYLAEERAFRQWWTSASPAPREALLADWRQLMEELSKFNAAMETRYQELVAAVQANSEDLVLARELSQTENLLLHSSFLLGWTTYFQGVLEPEERTSWLRQADEHFRDYLQIEPRKSLTEFSAKWFEFDSAWHLRALVGLAMCHRGLDHPQQSEHCFQLIQQAGDEEAQRLLFVWKLNSRLYVDQFSAAVQCAGDFGNEPGISTDGQVAFWINALQSSSAIERNAPQAAKVLRIESLAGLTRTLQAPVIQKVVEEQEFEFPDDFTGNWVQGYLNFYLSENSLTKQSYREKAKINLLRSLETVDARVSESDIARCRYLLARIHYREGDFAESARLFQTVAAAIVSDDRQLAAEAQWLAAQSLIESSRDDRRHSELAYAAIENLLRRFPESSYARRGEFEKLKLNLSSLPGDEAIRRLNRIEAGDPNYALAMEEKIRIRFRLLLDAISSGQSDRERRLEQLVEAEKTARDLAGISSKNRLKSILLVVDGLLRFEPVNETRISSLLSVAGELAELIRNRNASGYAEYRYYQMLFADKRTDLMAARKHAQWLVEQAAKSRFERAALIYLGSLWDSQLNQSSQLDPAAISQSLAVFRRLVEVLGSSQDVVTKSKNAQVAMRTLAELELLAGNADKADSIYQLLIQYFPQRQQYIHGRAKSATALENYSVAFPLWRKLAASVTAGTDLWYESKYQMVACLLPSDPQAAGQIYRQTIRLSPELPSEWRLPFRELAAKLDQ